MKSNTLGKMLYTTCLALSLLLLAGGLLAWTDAPSLAAGPDNIISNPSFDEGADGLAHWRNDGDVNWTVTGGTAQATVPAGKQAWLTQGIAVTPGTVNNNWAFGFNAVSSPNEVTVYANLSNGSENITFWLDTTTMSSNQTLAGATIAYVELFCPMEPKSSTVECSVDLVELNNSGATLVAFSGLQAQSNHRPAVGLFAASGAFLLAAIALRKR